MNIKTRTYQDRQDRYYYFDPTALPDEITIKPVWLTVTLWFYPIKSWDNYFEFNSFGSWHNTVESYYGFNIPNFGGLITIYKSAPSTTVGKLCKKLLGMILR